MSHTACGIAQTTSRVRVSSIYKIANRPVFECNLASEIKSENPKTKPKPIMIQPSRSDKTRWRTRALGRRLPFLDPTILVRGRRKSWKLLLSCSHIPHCFWILGWLGLLNASVLHLRANCPASSNSLVAVPCPLFYQWSLRRPGSTLEIKFTHISMLFLVFQMIVAALAATSVIPSWNTACVTRHTWFIDKI